MPLDDVDVHAPSPPTGQVSGGDVRVRRRAASLHEAMERGRPGTVSMPGAVMER
jgi:hypothetical protein